MLVSPDTRIRNSHIKRLRLTHTKMKKSTQFRKLRTLEAESAHIRKSIKVSKAGEILYHAPQSRWSDNDIVVEADGIGGARLLFVDGNYPIDYYIHQEKTFFSEQEACDAAEEISSE